MQIFYDAQGKLTPHTDVGSTLNSNSSKRLRLSLLPAKMKKIHLKMTAIEWSQQISHYYGIFPDAQWQLTPQSNV